MNKERKIEAFMQAFKVSYTTANDYLFADGYNLYAASESLRLVDYNRSLTADCAWFLVRTMAPITGLRHEQIEQFLRSATISRIECDAEGIQQDFYSVTADKAQELLVGRIKA